MCSWQAAGLSISALSALSLLTFVSVPMLGPGHGDLDKQEWGCGLERMPLQHQGNDRCWHLWLLQLELDSGPLSCPQFVPMGTAFPLVPLPTGP